MFLSLESYCPSGFFLKLFLWILNAVNQTQSESQTSFALFLVKGKDFFEHWSYFSFRKLKTNEKSFFSGGLCIQLALSGK